MFKKELLDYIQYLDSNIEFIDEDEYIIHHEELFKYGILKFNDIIGIKNLFQECNLIENKDYKIKKILVQLISRDKYIYEYYLNRKAFRICLEFYINKLNISKL